MATDLQKIFKQRSVVGGMTLVREFEELFWNFASSIDLMEQSKDEVSSSSSIIIFIILKFYFTHSFYLSEKQIDRNRQTEFVSAEPKTVARNFIQILQVCGRDSYLNHDLLPPSMCISSKLEWWAGLIWSALRRPALNHVLTLFQLSTPYQLHIVHYYSFYFLFAMAVLISYVHMKGESSYS